MPPSLHVFEQTIRTPYTWVDLVTDEMYEVLEAENTRRRDCDAFWSTEKCRLPESKPKLFSFPVYAEPSEKSPVLGKIKMLVSPGKGIDAEWEEEGSLAAVPFLPDDATIDWGYGSPFLATVLDVRANWVLLPRSPFQHPVWLNLGGVVPNPRLVGIQEFEIFELGSQSLVVLSIEGETLLVREEGKFDMSCDVGVVTEPENLPSFRLTPADVYDENLHLKPIEKYKKGC